MSAVLGERVRRKERERVRERERECGKREGDRMGGPFFAFVSPYITCFVFEGGWVYKFCILSVVTRVQRKWTTAA